MVSFFIIFFILSVKNISLSAVSLCFLHIFYGNKKNDFKIIVRIYKKITEMNTEEINFRNLLSCFFITDFEPSDLIIEYASYDLLKLGISEEFIIEKLYKYFGDIINLGNR